MKNTVVISKRDLFWSVSELVSNNVQDRIDWVRHHIYDDYLIRCCSVYDDYLKAVVYDYDESEGNYIQCPVYMIVMGSYVNNLDFTIKQGTRFNIYSIMFPENLNEVIIKTKEIIRHNNIPFLYIYNNDTNHFEMIDYKIGLYEEPYDNSNEIKSTAVRFPSRLILNAPYRYLEEYEWEILDDIDDYFIEIPDIYEMRYYDIEEEDEGDVLGLISPKEHIYKFRQCSSAIEDAICILYDGITREVIIQDSFAEYKITVDLDSLENLPNGDYDMVDFGAFKNHVLVECSFKYANLRTFEDIYELCDGVEGCFYCGDYFDHPERFETEESEVSNNLEDIEIDTLDETDQATSAASEVFEDINKKISKDMTKEINKRGKKSKKK